jgi:hypothetical protein
MTELVVALMLVASQLTGLPNADRLPDIEYLSEREMAERAYGTPLPRKRSIIWGQYTCYRNRLTLRDTWDKDDIASTSTLLHELVHHLQCAKHSLVWMMVSCKAETQAYAAEIEWMASQGENFYTVFRVSKAKFDAWLDDQCGRVE